MSISIYNTDLPIVGITGAAGSGKDTLAALLVERMGYVRMALADPIKELLNERFGWDPELWNDRTWKETPVGIAGNRSPRDWIQWLGTEVGRAIGGEDVWVYTLARNWARAERPLLVVPDIRFDDEAQWIHNIGGVVIEVLRTSKMPVRAHRSENGLSPHLVDFGVLNNGSPDDVFNKASIFLNDKRQRQSHPPRDKEIWWAGTQGNSP